jgi:hypothetical protein
MGIVTVDLPDALHLWLTNEAASRRTPIPDLIRQILSEQADELGLSPHESEALALFHSVSTKPGWVVPARNLRASWGVRGSVDDLSRALEGLMRKGLVAATADMAAFSLTAHGYSYQLKKK